MVTTTGYEAHKKMIDENLLWSGLLLSRPDKNMKGPASATIVCVSGGCSFFRTRQ